LYVHAPQIPKIIQGRLIKAGVSNATPSSGKYSMIKSLFNNIFIEYYATSGAPYYKG
jgi:hypothetical protein